MVENESISRLSARQKLILSLLVILSFVILAVMLLRPGSDDCSGIFAQTAPKLQANLEIIESRGGFAISQEKIQELSDSAQRVGLHLKTCCIVLRDGQLDAAQFQQCVQGAATYDRQVADVAQQVIAAQSAVGAGVDDELEAKAVSIRQGVSQATRQAATLAQQPLQSQSSQSKPTPTPAQNPPPASAPRETAEAEPNNSILEANQVAIGQEIQGQIAGDGDDDFFGFTYAGSYRDFVKVRLRNRSTSLKPWIKIFNASKSEIAEKFDYTVGADVSIQLAIEPGQTIYVQVLHWNTSGDYQLTLEPQKSYDAFEPNDDAFSARNITAVKVVEANIMDDQDVDWYLFKTGQLETLQLRLEPVEQSLRPQIKIYDANRSELHDFYNYSGGAILEQSFPVTPGNDYYLQVLPFNSRGGYRLTLQ